MKNIFVIGDLHFGDSDMCTVLDGNNTPLRPFKTVQEHDEALIDNWNKVVTHPSDKVYVVGDIAQKRNDIDNFARLMGKKILIRGNHDIYEMKFYSKYFKDIRATHRLDNGIIMSHIPLHAGTFGKAHKLNVHAHLHDKCVMKLLTYGKDATRHTYTPDLRYRCVSAEQISYTPIEITDIHIN